MELIKPEFGLFFWQTIVFLILLFLMAKYAWRPILNSVKKRENSINEALASAENARQEMKNLQADNEQLMKEAREERDIMLKEARQIKERVISDASVEAEEKANKIIANAQQAIITEKQAALAEIKEQVANLSLEIAEKVVQKQLDNKEEQMKLVEGMLNDVKLN